jgi:hypothetical protein
MLASITPLGERGRRSHWGLTAGMFLVAATAAGAALGGLLGAVGSVVVTGVSSGPRLAVFAVAAVVALVLYASPVRVPGPRRQVDERWRDEYRGWVYGAGYGAQLGVGITTVVQSAATYLALLGALLCGGWVHGALIVGLFGAARGVQPLAAAHVRHPEQLLALHARLHRAGSRARTGETVALVVLAALATGWAIG